MGEGEVVLKGGELRVLCEDVGDVVCVVAALSCSGGGGGGAFSLLR